MYRYAKQLRHSRYEGKRHGRTKRALFPSYRQGSKSLLNPGFSGVKGGSAGVLAPYLPCLDPGAALWNARGAITTQKSLFTVLRYEGSAKVVVFPSYRHSLFRR